MVGGAGGEPHFLSRSTASGPGGLAPTVPGPGDFAACGGELLSGCPERSQRGTGGGRRGTEPAAPALPQCRPPPGPPLYGGRQLGGMAGRRKGAGGMGIDAASPTAADAQVGFPVWRFSRLRARLCAGWGTSCAVVEGGGSLHPPGALAAPQEAREGNPALFHYPPHQGPVARRELGFPLKFPRAGTASPGIRRIPP